MAALLHDPLARFIAQAALIIVLSVMNGFEKDLENNILGLMPQALVTSPQGSVNPQQLPASEVQKLQGVTRVAPLTTGDVVLQSARSVAVGVMLGVNPDEADPLTPYLVNVKQQQLQPGQTVPVHITYADGRKEVIDTRCRIDTGNELTYYENDGILHYVIRKML